MPRGKIEERQGGLLRSFSVKASSHEEVALDHLHTVHCAVCTVYCVLCNVHCALDHLCLQQTDICSIAAFKQAPIKLVINFQSCILEAGYLKVLFHQSQANIF